MVMSYDTKAYVSLTEISSDFSSQKFPLFKENIYPHFAVYISY